MLVNKYLICYYNYEFFKIKKYYVSNDQLTTIIIIHIIIYLYFYIEIRLKFSIGST